MSGKDKYYLDTCIWRDFYEDRFSKTGRAMGRESAKLFVKLIKKRAIIFYNDSLIWKLRNDYDDDLINDMLNFLFLINILKKIETIKEDYLQAKKLVQERNIPFVDCLNAVQVRRLKAILVSQDKHLLNDLSDITKAKRPLEII
jgi:predicted nucleic acid-binding protein